MPSKQKSNHAKQKMADVSRSGFDLSKIRTDEMERAAALVGGGALLLYCLRKVTLADTLLAVAGGTLFYQGITHRSLNATEKVQRLREGVGEMADRARGWAQEVRSRIEERFGSGTEPILVEKSILINRSPEELYAFWRKLENLPRVMSHLESVTQTRGKRSHWVAKGPAGIPVEWDAEIIEDKKNEMISWQALEEADVPNEGAVYFEKAAEGQTELRVLLEYAPPGGQIAAAVAEFLGEDPSQKIEEDLKRFKEAVEGGEMMLDGGAKSRSRPSEEDA